MLQKILLAIILVVTTQNIMAETASSCENTDDIKKMESCVKDSYFAAKQNLQKKINDIQAQRDVSRRAKRLLNKAQKAWRQFRWNYCTFATVDMEGEVGHSFSKFDCLGRITNQQIENLQEYIEGLDV